MSSDWRPAAPLENLRARAELLSKTRQFFAERGVLEVETPLLCARTVTEPHVHSVSVGERFLQTSPEYAMKRLLAAGSGPIYQICKAFRAGEQGARHNPEFTMLEWYRPGFDHHALMDEVDGFLQSVLAAPPARKESYEAVFQHHVGLCPHRASTADLRARAEALSLDVHRGASLGRDDWLNLLMASVIEPHLGAESPLLVYDFPVELRALARIRAGDPPVAERFELYIQGMELANGYHELTDAREQRARFSADRDTRRLVGGADVAPDERLLAALDSGLPEGSGVALGFDRLVMVAVGASELDEVLSFPAERA